MAGHRRSVLAVSGTLAAVAGLVIWSGAASNNLPTEPATTSSTGVSPQASVSPSSNGGQTQRSYLKTIRYEAVDGGQVVVIPTDWARTQLPAPKAVSELTTEYKKKAPKRYQGQQYLWQLQCHAYFAVTKQRWEFETRNHRESLLDYVTHHCN
jgi:hypothetical protein